MSPAPLRQSRYPGFWPWAGNFASSPYGGVCPYRRLLIAYRHFSQEHKGFFVDKDYIYVFIKKT
jgi:hypothetical protein